MSATHYDEITPHAIDTRLRALTSVRVEWTGYMPADAERFDHAAAEALNSVEVADVRRVLAAHDLDLDSAADEIDTAIGICCEPSDLPGNACVVVS